MLKTSMETTNIFNALIRAQGKFPKIAFDKDNLYFRSRYATLGAVIDATKPILQEEGLAVTQWPTNDGERVGVTSRLVHVSGEWMEETVTIPLKGASDKTQIAQVAGIDITYLRRYSYNAILGLVADEDTDGNLDGYEKPPKQLRSSKPSKPFKKSPVKAKFQKRLNAEDPPEVDEAEEVESVEAVEETDEVKEDPNSMDALVEEFGHLWNKARSLGNPAEDLPKILKSDKEPEVIGKIADLQIILNESLGEEE